MRRGETSNIFARLHVSLRDDERCHAAGLAMGTYAWMLCFARERWETNGYVPRSALLRGAWAGPSGAAKHAKKLVDVGLISPRDDGFAIVDWGSTNDTPDVILNRRRVDAKRKRAERGGSEDLADDVRTDTEQATADVHSESECDLISSHKISSKRIEGENAGARAAPPPGPKKARELTLDVELVARVETGILEAGERIPIVGGPWLSKDLSVAAATLWPELDAPARRARMQERAGAWAKQADERARANPVRALLGWLANNAVHPSEVRGSDGLTSAERRAKQAAAQAEERAREAREVARRAALTSEERASEDAAMTEMIEDHLRAMEAS